MSVTADKLDLALALGPYFVFTCLLFLLCEILDAPEVRACMRRIIRPEKKAPAQQPMKGQSLYRLPAEVRLVIFKEVFFIDRGNIAMRSLLKALRKDPILLEEAHEVYYSMKNFRLTKANQWSFDKYTSTGIEHLQLVKHVTIDLRGENFNPNHRVAINIDHHNNAIREFKDRNDSIIAQAPNISTLAFVNDSYAPRGNFFGGYLLELLDQFNQLQEVSIEYVEDDGFLRSLGYLSHTERTSFFQDESLPPYNDSGAPVKYGLSKNNTRRRFQNKWEYLGKVGTMEYTTTYKNPQRPIR